MAFTKIVDWVSEIAGYAGAIIVIPLVGALVYEVFSRYALGAPTAWAYEISYMLTGSILMLGMGYALKHKYHVNVDFINEFLSTRSRSILDLIAYLALAPAIFWLSGALAQYAYRAFESGEVTGKSGWNPVVWPFDITWAIGFAILGLQMSAEAARAIRTLLGDRNDRGDK
ncbi:MAG: TRAP transporter small permease subunit [Burkholderiales bacterium]|nr:TRAP transporter small permease subunit [Burkholderiales bacterium]